MEVSTRMIHSMTGYGDVHYSDAHVSYVMELRSLNNRYFKLNIKLPEHLSLFEGELEKLLRTKLTRGSVSCSLRLKNVSSDAAQEINIPVVENYLTQLGKVSQHQNVRIDLAAILSLPGVCEPPEMDEGERERQWKIISGMTEQAMSRLIDMRRVEGKTIRDDLVEHCRI